jgi:hypothetical protein
MTCCAGTTSEEQTSRVVLARRSLLRGRDGRRAMGDGGMDGVGDMGGMEAQLPTWKRDTASCNYDHNMINN